MNTSWTQEEQETLDLLTAKKEKYEKERYEMVYDVAVLMHSYDMNAVDIADALIEFKDRIIQTLRSY